MKSIELTLKRVYLNLSSLTTNLLTFFLLFLVPTIFCLSTTVIAYFYYDFGLIITMTAMLSGFIVYGTVAGAFRRSTLNKNSELTIGVKWIDNITTIITMLIMAYVMIHYEILLFVIFNQFDILILNGGGELNLIGGLGWIHMYYWMFVTVIITYSISYFFQGFLDSDMLFFTIAVIFTIFIMILGATIFNYFYYTDTVHNPRLMDVEVEVRLEYLNEHYGMYWVSLFFPFYAPSQMMRLQGDALMHSLPTNSLWCWVMGEKGWTYNLLWFIPYFHIFTWWIAGFLYKWIRK